MIPWKRWSFLCLFFLTIQLEAQENETDFFGFWQSYSDIENALYKHFGTIAYGQLQKRREEIAQLKTPEDWSDRKLLVRKKLKDIVGPLPDKTPLNAKITGIVQKDGYRIEKIIYESIPGYFVTSALYVPDGVKENAPAIFYACGHSLTGFRSTTYQSIVINLVKKGFVVFTIDPMGQGERYEYWNKEKNEPGFRVPDHAHSYAGAQCMISGYSTARYFIWDVIRGIDYMLSRGEVDPSRLGMTGRSGGGNLTAYVGALDDRIHAAAPECYITSYEYIYKSIGPQCAEQNLYQMVASGLDHADFLAARAPKPTLIVSTTRDFFSIQGTRETYDEVKKMYKMLRKPENLSMIEDDDRHTSTKKNREAMYAFFQKELGNPGSSQDLEVDIPTPEELRVTKTGQLATSVGGKTINQLNRALVQTQLSLLRKSRLTDKDHRKHTILSASKISGFKTPTDYGKTIFSGRYLKPDYYLEKYLLEGSGDYKLPALVLKPLHNPNNRTVLIFDSDGMEKSLAENQWIHGMLSKGFHIVLVDLPGIGSLGPGYLKGDSYINDVSYNQWFGASLVGQSFVGLRAEDILRVVFFAKNQFKGNTVSAISKGPLASGLLHAAAFQESIESLILLSPFLSYAEIAQTQFYNSSYIPFTVPGAINKYDLPDLMASFCPKRLLILNPKSATGNTISNEKALEELHFPVSVYSHFGKEENIGIQIENQQENILKRILSFYD